MNIGIVGTGMMASAFAYKWATVGHRVMLSSRTAGRAEQEAVRILASYANHDLDVSAGSFGEAAAFGEVVMLAVKAAGVRDALAAAGPMEAKVLIDCGNPIVHDQNFETDVLEAPSLGEYVQQLAPKARVVKAFNTNFKEIYEYANPLIGGVRVNTFVASDDPKARELVMGLARDAMLDPIDCGALRKARHLESLASLIVFLGFGNQRLGPHIAFNLLRQTQVGSADLRRAPWLRTT